MKILVISDVESKAYWDCYTPGKLDGIDLIISCGDLSPDYLSFLVTMSRAPLLYVRGNHDGIEPNDGCVCLEDSIYTYKGVRILGLGGSMRYKDGPNQFTQQDMNRRIKRLQFKLMRSGGFDILVTHSPAFELGDGQDLPHIGFQGFLRLLDKYKPKFFIHGHIHQNYGRNFKRLRAYGNTTVINAYRTYIFEYDELTPPVED